MLSFYKVKDGCNWDLNYFEKPSINQACNKSKTTISC